MGDSINLDWGTLGTQPNPNAFMQGYNNARQISLQSQADHARNDALANPTDMNALTKFAVFDPQGADAVKGMLNYQMAARAREAYSQALPVILGQQSQSSYAPPNALTPPQTGAVAPQGPSGALPPVAPGASFQQAFAPVAQAPQGAPQQAPQSSPLTDPAHPAAQQVGQAALSGQISPAQAWAHLAQFVDPETMSKIVSSVSSMDDLRLKQLGESSGALGSEAQTLLGIPQPQRAAELQKIAPMLMQHGVTQQQLQQAMAEGLSDHYLQGVIGQVVGTQGIINNAVKRRELGQKDSEIGIQQQTANTTGFTAQENARHNRAEEQKGMPDGYGNIVNPITGKVIYAQGAGGFSAGATDYAAALTKVGLPANAVAGFMGNLHVESGFDPSRVGDGGLASGVAQWHPDRAAAFKAMFGIPPSQATPEQAAQFIKAELSKMPQAQQNAILNAPNPQAAAAAVDQYFERSDGKTRSERMAAASAWANGGGAGGMTSDAIQEAAEYAIAHGGKIQPGMARNKAATAAINNRLASLMKERGLTMGDVIAGGASTGADTQSLATLNKRATIIRASENAAESNADLALQKASKVGNGNIPVFNAWKNAGGRATGDPAIAGFNAAVETFSNEYAKVMGGGVPTDSLRGHAHAMLNTAQSPNQFQEVISTLKQDMANQSAGYERERQATLARLSGRSTPAQTATQQPPAGAVAMLRGNPTLRAAFDQKYGAGASARVLGS